MTAKVLHISYNSGIINSEKNNIILPFIQWYFIADTFGLFSTDRFVQDRSTRKIQDEFPLKIIGPGCGPYGPYRLGRKGRLVQGPLWKILREKGRDAIH